MGIVKEPNSVDFYTTGKQMTDADQKRVSEYIKKQKEAKKKKSQKSRLTKRAA